MLKINKLVSLSPIDYAAEELKKYLRMMMPEGGDIEIAYDPAAKEGFRLGLMADLGLDVSDAEELELDDIIYINCDASGGIIAGSNPRSVLLSVYEYLRQNGCRWLLPGVDGEYIPMKDIEPVKYRHKASARFRGLCNEGAEYQECMMETIDFLPKVGMNVYMLEFRVPRAYYDRYYNHPQNPTKEPEPISEKQIIRWKRQCEAEIAKRGLQFHDIGHGWTVECFGIPANTAWEAIDESEVPREAIKYLAEVNGVRGLNEGKPMNTNFCMSNPEARALFVKYIADYAEGHSNVDYLHVWLSDGVNNHCECDNCRRKTPSDFYMILMNELDLELTKRKLDTRIVFIVYTDTTWPPLTERINNPKRFSILLAPITRSYLYTTDKEYLPRTVPFKLNNLVYPESLDEYFAYFAEWQKFWRGTAFSYEYHFWHHQYKDPGGIGFARRVSEDIKEYKKRGVNGIVEDGSQRSFYPTGLVFYTYARTLYDMSLTPEEIAEDYLSAAFGEEWREIYNYLESVSKLYHFGYIGGEIAENDAKSAYYAPSFAEKIKDEYPKILDTGRALCKKYHDSKRRVGTVSIRLLESHITYLDYLFRMTVEKARGNDGESARIFLEFREHFGALEPEMRRYFDNFLFFRKAESIFRIDKTKELNATEI